MDLHLHWFTAAALAITELITAASMRRPPVFRLYLLLVALRVAFPYARIADSPWLDGTLLIARAAITAELFLNLGWRVMDKTWVLMCIGCFQVLAVLALYDFPVQPDATHPWFVLDRQIVHVELFFAALTAVSWVWYHGKRHSKFAMIHGVLMVGYLFNYVAAGFWIAKWPADRDVVLVSFDLVAMGLLGLWICAGREEVA